MQFTDVTKSISFDQCGRRRAIQFRKYKPTHIVILLSVMEMQWKNVTKSKKRRGKRKAKAPVSSVSRKTSQIRIKAGSDGINAGFKVSSRQFHKLKTHINVTGVQRKQQNVFTIGHRQTHSPSSISRVLFLVALALKLLPYISFR